MIVLNFEKCKQFLKNNKHNNINDIINAYYDYCNCNDLYDIKCPCCGNHVLKYHKTYERNLIIFINNKLMEIKINISVYVCTYCSKIKGRQKYHALLPCFILPYSIYEASTIIKALLCYCNKIKVKDILERLKIRHKTFYDWINKFNIYSFSASTVLKVNNVIKTILNNIIIEKDIFLNKFYNDFNHPFFLFKLTCVPLCITS